MYHTIVKLYFFVIYLHVYHNKRIGVVAMSDDVLSKVPTNELLLPLTDQNKILLCIRTTVIKAMIEDRIQSRRAK